MLGNRYQNLEGWTDDRLKELRQVAATEAQLKALGPRGLQARLQGVVAHVGHTMVSWGTWLERQGRQRPLGLEQGKKAIR